MPAASDSQLRCRHFLLPLLTLYRMLAASARMFGTAAYIFRVRQLEHLICRVRQRMLARTLARWHHRARKLRDIHPSKVEGVEGIRLTERHKLVADSSNVLAPFVWRKVTTAASCGGHVRARVWQDRKGVERLDQRFCQLRALAGLLKHVEA